MTIKVDYNIISCLGCDAWPMRYTPFEKVRTEINYLLRCLRCGRPMCRDCMPDEKNHCLDEVACQKRQDAGPWEAPKPRIPLSQRKKMKKEKTSDHRADDDKLAF